MFNLNLTFYFQRSDEKDYHVPIHSHRCYELVYYFSGKGHCRVAEKKLRYDSGHFVLIPPDTAHNDVHEMDCRIACVGFTLDENIFPPFNDQLSFSDPDGKVAGYLAGIDREFRERKQDFMIAINNLLENVVLEIKRTVTDLSKMPTGYKDTILQALNYINEYFLTDISKKQLAEITNYSYDRFRHIFKSILGISPKQYIINKRLEHSKTLLATTSLSITEIAYQCGFASTSHFIRAFKQSTNLTPAQHRKQLHAELIFTPEQSIYKNKNRN